MIPQLRTDRLLFIRITFALALLTACCFAQAEEDAALKTVRGFYDVHFSRSDRMYFNPQNILLKKKWLTPRLYRLMLYEFRREKEYAKAHAGQPQKPYFSGDVFTDSESLPQVFRITGAKQNGNRAWVTVMVYWNDNTVGKMKRKIRVVLMKQEENWLIDNLLYEQGKDLVSELRRPSYY